MKSETDKHNKPAAPADKDPARIYLEQIPRGETKEKAAALSQLLSEIGGELNQEHPE